MIQMLIPLGLMVTKEAYGRFIRGIDKSRKNIDPEGECLPSSSQEDALQNHRHHVNGKTLESIGKGSVGKSFGKPMDADVGPPITDEANGEPGFANETRPKKTAFLYCKRQ